MVIHIEEEEIRSTGTSFGFGQFRYPSCGRLVLNLIRELFEQDVYSILEGGKCTTLIMAEEYDDMNSNDGRLVWHSSYLRIYY